MYKEKRENKLNYYTFLTFPNNLREYCTILYCDLIRTLMKIIKKKE